MGSFFILLSIFSGLLHLYVGWRVVPALSVFPALQMICVVLLLTSAVLIPCALFARRAKLPYAADLVAWTGFLLMGLFSSLFVLTITRDVFLFAVAAMAINWPSVIQMGTLEVSSALALLALAILVTICGLVNARRIATVVEIDIPITNLPPVLHGFSIVQISDIHIGPTIKIGYLRAIVAEVNKLDPDMIAITGDLVDGAVLDLAHHVAPLAELISRHGSYFVTGNHEYYSGAHEWVIEIRRLGITVLMNEHIVLDHGAATVVVAGVTDFSAHRFDASHQSDPHLAIAGAPQDVDIRLLLAHQPRSAAAAQKAGFHLQLSGHTHGGQFFPWNFFVRLQQPFSAGLHRLEDLWVYTSRGTGYWGPPKRLFAPSEITRIRLVCASA